MDTSPNNIHPDHLADLKKSGLSDETIKEAGFYSVRPGDISKKLGYDNPNIKSLLAIPYPGCNGFERYKPFPVIPDLPKYLQKKDSGNRLYIIPQTLARLKDPAFNRDLIYTEGEKKTLAGAQAGLTIIGLSGLWNWSDGKKELIPDFDQIVFQDRQVFIIPDSDWLNPNRHGYEKNLKKAVYELAYRLIDRGAKVFIVELPQEDVRGKVGLDDYLCQHKIEEFRTLPIKEIRKLTLEEMIQEATIEDSPDIIKRIACLTTETEKGIFIEKLSKKLKVSKRNIQKDINTLTKKPLSESSEITIKAHFPGLVDIVHGEADEVAFLIKAENGLQVEKIWDIEGSISSPPEKRQLPFELSRAEAVLKWVKLDNDRSLFEDLLRYCKRFSSLPNDHWILVVCNIFLTYLQDHPDIQYFPEILFFAVPERGKSRTAKAVIYVSFRGIHIVDLREANLFRYSQDLKATLFLDIMDLWKKAERNGCEDILLCRYEKGQRVSRVLYPEKGAFNDMVFFEIYGPTLIATNEPVHKILGSRCLPITMPNKPGDYENPTPQKAQELKERLTAWRARTMGNPLPEVETMDWLNGRLWDISKPLLQLCIMVNPMHIEGLIRSLKEIAGQRLEDKRDSIEGKIMIGLNELSPKGLPEWVIETSKLLGTLNEDRPEDRKLKPQWLGRKLKAMGITTRIVHGYSEMVLNQKDLDLLLYQFGIITPPTSIETLPNSTSLLNQINLNSYPGRELVGSGGNSTQTLPNQHTENITEKRVVENGRELEGVGNQTIIDLMNVDFEEVQ